MKLDIEKPWMTEVLNYLPNNMREAGAEILEATEDMAGHQNNNKEYVAFRLYTILEIPIPEKRKLRKWG